jgi:hypothetical protein
MGCCCSCFSLRKVYIERTIRDNQSGKYSTHVEQKYINIDRRVGIYKSRNHASACLLKNKTTNKILICTDTFREQGINSGSCIQVISQNQPFTLNF